MATPVNHVKCFNWFGFLGPTGVNSPAYFTDQDVLGSSLLHTLPIRRHRTRKREEEGDMQKILQVVALSLPLWMSVALGLPTLYIGLFRALWVCFYESPGIIA
jgi:hypothetical protein